VDASAADIGPGDNLAVIPAKAGINFAESILQADEVFLKHV